MMLETEKRLEESVVYKRMQRKRQFTDLTGYKGDRLILGFYYYINEDKIGNRDEGWLMMAHDKIPEVRP